MTESMSADTSAEALAEAAGRPEAPLDAEAPEHAETFRGDHVVARPLPRPAPPLMLTLPGTIDFGDAAPSNAQEQQSRDRIMRLAEANANARADALERLSGWFPGYDFAQASQTTDDRRFVVLQIGDALFDHLDALATVERLLTEHDHPGTRLIFSHGERRGEQPARVLDPARPAIRRARIGPLVDLLEQRWTTILNGIDDLDPKIAGVTDDLERVYGCRVNTNVYISWGDARGFGPHWDMHDTIIVPAAGTKRWKVFEPSTLSPLRPWVGPEVSPRPVWEGDLTPGMCLVIPRGWGHEVLGSEDLAVHYTIGVNRITVQDALERLTTEGGFSPLFRADLAYDPSEQVHSYETSIHDGDVLSERVAELASPELIGRALATSRARMPIRSFTRLFDAWVATGLGEWDGASVRLSAPAGVHLAAVSPQGAQVAVGDLLIDLTMPAFELVIQLADGRAHRVDELADEAPDGIAVAEVLRELVRAALVDIELH